MADNRLSDQAQLEADLSAFLADRIRRACPHVPIEERPTVERFKADYVARQRPVLLRGLADGWEARERWDFDYFAEHCGASTVCANLYDARHTRVTSMASLIDDLKHARPDTPPVYLQEWWFQTEYPKLFDAVAPPEHFRDDENLRLLGFYNATLWIGAAGAITPFHQDTVFNNIWTAQIRGRKEWILFDKEARLADAADGGPDYDALLADPANGVAHCRLEPGDILYVPYKTWHRTLTLEDAISLNTFYITGDIVRRYVRDVLAIPLAAVLNADLLREHDLRRYNICMARVKILAQLLGLDADNVLGVDTARHDPRAQRAADH